MNEYQRGYADNYAGVARCGGASREWLAGWDEAQSHRLQDEREIRKATFDLQNQWVGIASENTFGYLSFE
jgi:hypothetical protein